MKVPTTRKDHVTRLDYVPRGRPLDLEIFSFANLRERGPGGPPVGATHRYAFYLLVCVTRGRGTQIIDFEPIDCAPGSFLVLRPGQVHSFGDEKGWDGWLVLFRAEFLPSASESKPELFAALGVDRLPNHVTLRPTDLEAVAEALNRMYQDSTTPTPPDALHAILRYQLCALLLRLTILNDREQHADLAKRPGLMRFARFRQLVEENHAGWHQVAEYADALGCTEKSLTRAAIEATGHTAKEFISERLALEAKRLLAHTDRPVYLIAEGLGFDEASNFAKFFRRETGTGPLEFRREHSAKHGASICPRKDVVSTRSTFPR